MIFTNKHVIIAMIVAPILAILAYYAIDALISETPHQAEPGQVYKLVAKPSCRYESGMCELRNNDVEMTLTGTQVGNALDLALKSNIALEGAQLAVSTERGGALTFSQPMDMRSSTTDNHTWDTTTQALNHQKAGFRLVVYIQGSAYFAEFPAVFLVNATTPQS